MTRLLVDVGSGVAGQAEAEAELLSAWPGDVRFVPRFQPPIERELT